MDSKAGSSGASSSFGADVGELCEQVRARMADPKATAREQLAALARIRECLECHNERLDESGIFEDMAFAAPYLAPRVREFRQSRWLLLTTISRLASLIEKSHASKTRRHRRVLRMYDRFVEALLEHRATEQSLRHEAFNTGFLEPEQGG